MKRQSLDELYELLPAIYRLRDADQGLPLQALLRVIGEQAGAVKQDIDQLYDNWFIETCQPWVVPYLGDLIGLNHHAISHNDDGESESRQTARERLLNPRREIGEAVNRSRRKGTLAVLEELATDIAGWHTRAVEMFRLVTQFPSLRRAAAQVSDQAARDKSSAQRLPALGRVVDFRDRAEVARIGTPFDTVAHFPAPRSASDSARAGYSPDNVALYVWRLRTYSLTMTRPRQICCTQVGSPYIALYTFDPLGLRRPLYIRPGGNRNATAPAQEWNVPGPLTIGALEVSITQASSRYYGPDKSLAVYLPGDAAIDEQPGFVPAASIVPKDLSGKMCPLSLAAVSIKDGEVAVDPEHGLLAVRGSLLPRATFHYAFSADIGGGEYHRDIEPDDPRNTRVYRERSLAQAPDRPQCDIPKLTLSRFLDAVAIRDAGKSQQGACCSACTIDGGTRQRVVVEICDSGVYELDSGHPDACCDGTMAKLCTTIGSGIELVIRAAQGCRPVVCLPYSHMRNGWKVHLAPGGALTLDGIVVSGGPIIIESESSTCPSNKQPLPASTCHMPSEKPGDCKRHFAVRHCTILSGEWQAHGGPPPCPPSSLEVAAPGTCVVIDHSIVGRIVQRSPDVKPAADGDDDPIQVFVRDCIVDGQNHPSAIDGEGLFALTAERSTILGRVNVREIVLGQDSIFHSLLAGECRVGERERNDESKIIDVRRRQSGGLRFCYAPPTEPWKSDADWQWSTPRQYYCQPALAKARSKKPTAQKDCGCASAAQDLNQTCGESTTTGSTTGPTKIYPKFTSSRYGDPGYCQLTADCCREIRRGAEDESEMGAFHDLYEPQREANLRARLADFTPAAMQIQIVFVPEQPAGPRE